VRQHSPEIWQRWRRRQANRRCRVILGNAKTSRKPRWRGQEMSAQAMQVGIEQRSRQISLIESPQARRNDQALAPPRGTRITPPNRHPGIPAAIVDGQASQRVIRWLRERHAALPCPGFNSSGLAFASAFASGRFCHRRQGCERVLCERRLGCWSRMGLAAGLG